MIRILYFSSQKKTVAMGKVLIILFLCCCCFANSKAQRNDSVFAVAKLRSFTLQKSPTNAANFHLPAFTQPVLFLFLSTECPLCQNYTATLNNLYNQYHQNITVYGVFTGTTFSEKNIADFRGDYKIAFPFLIDSSRALTNYLGASVTPEAILISQQAELLYKGAIDNWMISLGKKRAQVTEHFLKEALENTIHQKDIVIKRTKAIGCKLNDF